MKTLVISDSHLNLPFEEKKFRFLESIIRGSDKVIINGDFWEGFRISFDQFLDSPYKHLFPLLKARNTVYIFGNHDQEDFFDDRATLFADHIAESYTMQVNGSKLIFKHGDQYALIINNKCKPPLKGHRRVLSNMMNEAEKIIVRKLGKKAMRQVHGRYNTIIKKKIRKELKDGEILVCGHTHMAEFNPKEKFINSGLIKHGLGQYLIVENTTITPKEAWYD